MMRDNLSILTSFKSENALNAFVSESSMSYKIRSIGIAETISIVNLVLKYYLAMSFRS